MRHGAASDVAGCVGGEARVPRERRRAVARAQLVLQRKPGGHAAVGQRKHACRRLRGPPLRRKVHRRRHRAARRSRLPATGEGRSWGGHWVICRCHRLHEAAAAPGDSGAGRLHILCPAATRSCSCVWHGAQGLPRCVPGAQGVCMGAGRVQRLQPRLRHLLRYSTEVQQRPSMRPPSPPVQPVLQLTPRRRV